MRTSGRAEVSLYRSQITDPRLWEDDLYKALILRHQEALYYLLQLDFGCIFGNIPTATKAIFSWLLYRLLCVQALF